MRNTLIFNTICIFLKTCVQSTECVPALVHAPAGEIQGYSDQVVVDGRASDITRFLGIPYAEPPTGDNRFQKPIPKARFNGVFRADSKPVSCIQASKSSAEYYADKVSNFTEDCLVLNIYVPIDVGSAINAGTTFPTMVWIFGGGFTSGNTADYNPDVLSVLTDTIVVTLNYRVGMFGFLQSQDGQFNGNQGLWDQQLAIKWVNQNIASFYGSPDKVTIFGESAGSVSVLYQALYPGNKGMFQRVIAESGTPLSDWALVTSPNAGDLFNAVGCAIPDPLACLNSKTYDELYVPDDFLFSPALDGDFIKEPAATVLFGDNPVSQDAREFFYSLDILTGINRYDGAMGLPYWEALFQGTDFNISDPHITRDQLKNILFLSQINQIPNIDPDTADLLTRLSEQEYIDWSNPDSFNMTRMAGIEFFNDFYFFHAAIRTVQSHTGKNANGSTYFYEFCPKPSQSLIPTPDWITGANHADELEAVFVDPLQQNPSRKFTQEERQMSRIMMTLWTNFAKSGDPNMPADVTKLINTTWPEYDMTSQKYLQLTNEMSAQSVKSHFYGRRMHFWSDIVPYILEKQEHKTTTTTTTTTTKKPVDSAEIIG